jgi:NAD(P)-dependent dehydrogenase (short-subunit alcohol dehydrogenase family)
MAEKRIFVTGGASGLGLAIAQRYARAGYRVCIGDVNDERGKEAEPKIRANGASDVFYTHCDVRQEDELARVASELEARWGGVDIVVNNAGVAQAGAIEDVSIADWQWILDINLLGVVRGCRVFTPMFKRQKHGHFVNVASMAGLLDMPLMSSYNVSKAGVVSLSETLQLELGDHGIQVTVVCPSFFKTNLAESLRTPDPRLRKTVDRLLDSKSLTAEDIADQIYGAVEKRVMHVLPHAEGRAAWQLKRMAPRTLYTAIMKRQTRRIHAQRS